MEGLIEGRIVHYVMPSGDHRPAMIVRVWQVTGKVGYVNLLVFVDGTNDVKGQESGITTTLWETSKEYSEHKEVGTWHWIEKA